ncbi:phosphoribosyl-AMP cyclohydrolase [Desulfococcaceae bacterium OttesenSCG-928-F15]|nr:phosphoribosyl-AMP cyclohydrolase [Desulfococcaceae bacterium OttesenSCG-928-F15]
MLIDFEKNGGLLPVIAQDAETGEVLMLAYMNEEAFRQTLATKKATYFSRSRNRLWVKGESSGNEQELVEARLDCDGDTILLKIIQKGGAACHTGHKSCFYRRFTENGGLEILGSPLFDPDKVYGSFR